jgi:rfaE bifunctional protein nucleotidyltransferase chain/domain
MRAMSLEEALAARAGRSLVFTNGVFDILHVGHLSLLEAARGLGDMLIVGINTDAGVRALGKGPNRPINTEQDRARMLLALRCVDGVVLFDEPTPERLIAALRPEVHVKGGDYRVEDLPEACIVHSYGGRVVIVPYVEGVSTTRLIAAQSGQMADEAV